MFVPSISTVYRADDVAASANGAADSREFVITRSRSVISVRDFVALMEILAPSFVPDMT